MPRPRGVAPSLALLSALLLPPISARASEMGELDADVPLTVEDAFVVEPGQVELQASARYDRRKGRDVVRLQPRVEVGLAEGLEAELFFPYSMGSGRRFGESGAAAGLLYNLNRERGWLPAFAVGVEVAKPVGPERRGPETELTGIATKTIHPAVQGRLHLNVSWVHALRSSADERRDRYRVVAGYSRLLSTDVALVLDYVHQRQEERRGRDVDILEAGVLYRLTETVAVGAGAGFGIGRDSPRFRASASIRIGFGGS